MNSRLLLVLAVLAAMILLVQQAPGGAPAIVGARVIQGNSAMPASRLVEATTPSAESLMSRFLPIARRAAISSATPIPHFSHIFTIVMENSSYERIIGNTQSAPYINSLAQQYGIAVYYYAIMHPSLPNYIALTAGDTF